ncbi:EpsG family protein [Enterobacter kobei]|uniref:EpsG family protein n=1 Tax=Enterobacter kobei TaxID=208224 RepID=UPI0020062960|nr:EpsG family protein [Enterobacter kobei]MCK7154288.1 EpsG family protein [Enterobacter kobei]MCK7214780.1 EpsG family protein [Enterobacter kobei]HDZ8317476.1 EpsG family protein [Enterobacter kobei]
MYWIYCLIFLFCTSLLERGRFATVAYKLSIFILFIFVTGNYYNGIDWINYQYHYNSIVQGGGSSEFMAYEPGFMLIMYFFGSIFNVENFHVVVFFASSMAILSFQNFIKKIPFKFNRSLFIFGTIAFIYPLFNDAIRQLLAFSILLPLLPNIRNCSLRKIILLCFLASLFHASAILMIPFLVLLRMQLTKQNMILLFLFANLFVLLLLGLNVIVVSMGGIIPQLFYAKLLSYISKASELKLGFFAIIDCLGILIIFISHRGMRTETDKNVYAMGAYLFFLFHLAFYTAPFLQRLLYFIFPLVVLYAGFIFPNGKLFSITKVLLPITLTMAIFVFIRNITNPYYIYDFNDPKFYYSNLFQSNPINLEYLKANKCMAISEIDPEFCPR